jgi:dTDP-4-dehydrorhamnose reductase
LPLNVYGCSKLAGEYFVRSLAPKQFVVRTSGIYGHNPCRAKGGLNFVELMLKLGRERGEVRVVDDEFVSPTATAELARQMVELSSATQYGLYHATAEDSCSWFEFAREIFAVTGMKVNVKVASPGEFPAKVPRPSYSVLENKNLKSLGLNTLRSWQAGLRTYLAERVQQTSAHVAA